MRYIDQDKLYEATDDGRKVFAYYYPTYDFGKHPAPKIKIRKEEKTASAHISFYKGLWRITDFGNQTEINSLSAIDFVMHIENLNYQEALMFIEEVIVRHAIGSSEFKRPQWRPDYECRDMGPDDIKGTYTFERKDESEITTKDLEAFGRYVTKEVLREFNCVPLKSYEYCAYSEKKKKDVVHKFIATADYPIFLFDYGDFQKLYRPHDLDKKNRFIYVGNKPKNYIYGFRQLTQCSNEFVSDDDEDAAPPKDKPQAIVRDLFRCSGESDALNLYSLGFHVYWLNSETAELSYDEYKRIDDLCQNHYQIMDLDSTGRQMALKNAIKYIDMYTLELPEWLGAKKDFRGNPCKDLKDFINLIGDDADATRQQFLYRKAKARRVKFWSRNDKGEYAINMEFYYFFLRANGFYQMEYRHMKNTDYCYVWLKGKVVDLIPPENIKRIVKRFTKAWIKSKNLTDEIAILNKLNTSNQITEGNIDTMESIELNFKNVSAKYEYMHFKNGSLRISRDAIERIRHEEVPNYILGSITVKNEIVSHVIPQNISLIKEPPAIEVNATETFQQLLDAQKHACSDVEREAATAAIALLPEEDRYEVKINNADFIFAAFLRDITRMYWRKELEEGKELTEDEHKKEMLALANMMFCIGYLAAQYKNQGKPWIVFIQDTKISELGRSSGRSGKSLVSKALKFVRQHFYIEGRKLDDKNQFQFIYDGLTEFHDVIEVDDLAENGDFTFFYTQATGNRTVNSKHTSPFVLEYEDSGKMIVSSNFELPNTDSSTMARLLNCGVSDYYHEQTKFNDYKETRSPLTKFGRQLYTDFTDDEWIQFYNFIAYCIQLQMRFDKIMPPMENLEKRQLRKEMAIGLGKGEPLLKWADDYFQVWQTKQGARPARTPDGSDCAYLDTLFSRKAAFEHFMENSGISENLKRSYNAQRFKSAIVLWAKYHEFVFNPARLINTKDGRIMSKDRDNKSVELFYISTTDTIEENVVDESSTMPTEPTINLPF